MNDYAIRKLARQFNSMSDVEAERFSVLIMEPMPMEQDEIISQIHTAQAELVQLHGKESDLANFAGTLAKYALYTIQDHDIMVEEIVVHKRTFKPGMRAKIVVRTAPIHGVHWFASIDTWQEGER